MKNLERWLEVEVENKAFSVTQEVQIVFLVSENRCQNALSQITQTLFKMFLLVSEFNLVLIVFLASENRYQNTLSSL